MDTLQQLPTHGDGLLDMRELARTPLESMINELMDAQTDMLCEDGAIDRNGYRERGLATPVGDITLRIPKLRAGTYFPEGIIERYSRVDRAVIAAVSEMVTDGASAGKVKRVAQAMGIDRMSASQVSRMCSSLDEPVADLRKRGLSDVTHSYIWLDATYIKCRGAGRVRSAALATAIGAGSGGCRRLLGLDAVDTESHGGWKSTPRSLRARGVDGVICVTSDAREGLKRAIREVFPGAAWQRRTVHLMRDAAGNAPTRQKKGPCWASRRPCSPSATPSSRGGPASSPPPG